MLFALARFLSCGLWLMLGLYKVTHFRQTTDLMASKGIPAPSFFLVLTLLMELFGTIMMFTNTYVWLAALAWIAFTIACTPIYHGKFVVNGTIDFLHFTQVGKNMSLVGGLVALVALDPTLPTALRTLLGS